ncbi:swan [Ditylenchus destructor]|uniref:Swan n=1 Tax=Ditylenchus destructor TaxID=166010 RepID=A0AAD4N7A3_9BILA|nr:swan [Ditylenchus destructor]
MRETVPSESAQVPVTTSVPPPVNDSWKSSAYTSTPAAISSASQIPNTSVFQPPSAPTTMPGTGIFQTPPPNFGAQQPGAEQQYQQVGAQQHGFFPGYQATKFPPPAFGQATNQSQPFGQFPAKDGATHLYQQHFEPTSQANAPVDGRFPPPSQNFSCPPPKISGPPAFSPQATQGNQGHFWNQPPPMQHMQTAQPPSATNVYVELTHLPADLLRPANLERFLNPTVPLGLSSVKAIYGKNGEIIRTLVKFGSEDDAKRVLSKDGQQGIRIRPSTEAAFNYAMDGLFSAVTKENVPDRTMTSKRGSPPMHHNQRRQSDEDLRSKRRRDESWTHHREKSPNGHAPGNGDDYNKPRDRDKDRRDRSPSRSKDRNRSQRQPPAKERICLQFTNVPYKATYDNIQEYIKSANARCEKITRTYYNEKKLSDRWIVEFSNDRDAKDVVRYRGEILGRRVRCEYINPRAADDQYAIPEPDNINQKSEYNHQPDRKLRQINDHFEPPAKPPSMALEAPVIDELITRGDLPPTAFGAFQSAAPVNVSVLRNSGETSQIGQRPPMPGKPPMGAPFRGPPSHQAFAPRGPRPYPQDPRPRFYSETGNFRGMRPRFPYGNGPRHRPSSFEESRHDFFAPPAAMNYGGFGRDSFPPMQPPAHGTRPGILPHPGSAPTNAPSPMEVQPAEESASNGIENVSVSSDSSRTGNAFRPACFDPDSAQGRKSGESNRNDSSKNSNADSDCGLMIANEDAMSTCSSTTTAVPVQSAASVQPLH